MRVSFPNFIKGKVKGNLIYAYWGWSLNNFGDLLTPLILNFYGLTAIHAYPKRAQLVGVGTLLGYMNSDFKGILLGTGINNGEKKIFPNAEVIGLRGKLTQKTLGLENDPSITLGDPGLLVRVIFPKRKKKRYKLGIIPHLSDINHPIITLWKRRFENDVVFINVLQYPEKVIQQIDECEYIVSSSLHGLIVADAFEIPNCRFLIKEEYVYEYNDFRFEDYYSVLGITGTKLEVDGSETISVFLDNMRNDFSMIQIIVDSLDKSFKEFVHTYLNETSPYSQR